MGKFTFIGQIWGRAAFYCPKDKSFAVEHDHAYLMEPTPEEAAEIFKIYPNLKPPMKAESGICLVSCYEEPVAFVEVKA